MPDRPWRDVLAELDKFDPHEPGTGLPLDLGIRRYVLILRAEGIETYESCQGGEGHCYPEPTVRFSGTHSDGFRAFAVAMTYGLPVRALRRCYTVWNGFLEGPHWELTFTKLDGAP